MIDVFLHIKNAFFSLSVTAQLMIFIITFVLVIFIFFVLGRISGRFDTEQKFKNLLKEN